MVPVYGNAKGENFDYYRLQFGPGLNPSSWIQIGENVHEPATEGKLADWDTGCLIWLVFITAAGG
jgi:hypothetical protein